MRAHVRIVYMRECFWCVYVRVCMYVRACVRMYVYRICVSVFGVFMYVCV